MRVFSKLSVIALVGVLVVTLGQIAMAQELSRGLLEGTIAKENGDGIDGAIVTLTGPRGVLTAVADKNGRFSFRDLIPASYTVKAEAPGFSTVVQTDVDVVLGRRTQLPFTLTAGKVETVTVSAEAPVVDQKSTSIGAVIDVEGLVNYIPLGRNFTDMFTLSPGVTSGLQSGAGNFSISGSSGLENSYLIDGVNITNSGYGGIGSYNRVFGSLGSGVTNDFIDSVEIKEGGFESEFGQATGGVINAVVKSGTNELAGQFSVYATPDSTEQGRRELLRFPDVISIQEEDQLDYGLNFGGPLIKDRLFWYAAYNRVESETTFKRNVLDDAALYFAPTGGLCPAGNGQGGGTAPFPGSLNGAAGCAFDQNQLAQGRTETRERTNDNYAAKVSWFVTPNHRIEATAFGDPSDGDSGPQRRAALRLPGSQGFSSLEYGGNNFSVKYFGAITPNLFIDALYAYHESELIEDALNIYRIDDLDIAGGLQTGGLGFSPDTDEEVDQISLKATYVWRNHEFKLGYQKDEIDYIEAGRNTGPNFTARMPISDGGADPLWDSTATCVDLSPGDAIGCDPGGADDGYALFASTTGASIEEANGIFATQRSRFSPVEVLTMNEEENWFAQWTYNPIPEVTIKAGLRRTEETVAGGSPFALPFGVVRNSGAGGARTRMVDLSVTQQLNPTVQKFPTETVPRLGVAWDIKGDGRHKAYLNYGEYVQRLTQDLAFRAFSNEVDIRQSWLDPDLTVPSTDLLCPTAGGDVACQGITAATGLGGPSTVFPGTELPITKEFLIGYSREINSTTGLDIRYIHRELDKIIEDFSYVPQESINNAIWGSGFGLFPFDPYPTYPAEFFGDYVLANVGENSAAATAVAAPANIAALYASGQVSDFPEARRDYDAVEIVLNKRFNDNWVFFGSYRFGKLVGNYEGLLRNDNGQDDPNITSLYDFPATPLLAGQFTEGRLNTDAEHNLKAFGTYQFNSGLSIGGALGWTSGLPRFPLLLHPNDFYQLAGNGELAGTDPVYGQWLERQDLAGVVLDAATPGCTDFDGNGDCDPLFVLLPGINASPSMVAAVDAAGMPMLDPTTGDLMFVAYTPADPSAEQQVPIVNGVSGLPQFLYDYTAVNREFNGRTPDQVNVDLHIGYEFDLSWRDATISLAMDVFNIFNSQETVLFDDVVEFEQGTPNPNLFRPTNDIRPFQEPRTFRFGARINF